MRCVCAAAGIVALSALSASAAGPELIVSTLPSSDTSLLPGTVDSRLVTDFGPLFRSPSGNRWIMQSRADTTGGPADVILTGTGASVTTQFRGDQENPWQPGEGAFAVLGSVTDQYAINDSGDFAFGINELARDVLVLNNNGAWSIVARETETVPFDPTRVWPGTGFDVAGVSADGTQVSYHIANVDTAPASTAVTYLVINGVPQVAVGTTVPTGQLTSPDRPYDAAGSSTYFQVDGAGDTWIAVASLSGSTTNDDIVVLNNNVIAQESFAFSTKTANRRLAGPEVSGNGLHWYVRGQATDNTTNWVAKDSDIVASTGEPITTGASEIWANPTGFSRTFFQITGNDAGGYVVIGGTNAAAPGNAVAVYNGSTVLLRQGEPIDVDGNGMFDDNVFLSFADTGSELYTSFLSNDGYFYTTVQILDGVGADLGEAVIRVRVPSSADFNGVGGVTVQDIFDFLSDWSSQIGGGPVIIRSADFNGESGVTVQDIFDFLTAWSMS
jgi:hypothetical protein